MRKQGDEAEFEVWPENWAVLEIFLSLATCWTWVAPGFGTPVRTGIPAQEVQAAMTLLGIDRDEWPLTYRRVRDMESAALAVFAQ
ncbi:DUF1799 domain-containing protein [Bordetella ansorpii]|nr:DUF1799 domain-containing protein [Bordetella ansorpii]